MVRFISAATDAFFFPFMEKIRESDKGTLSPLRGVKGDKIQLYF